jgi:hypothetical protein
MMLLLFYACNFLLVLHPCGEYYNAIGECYIDGVMDGEPIEAKELGEYQELEINLC